MSKERILEYLQSEFQKRGGDFYISSKKILRILHCNDDHMSTKKVGKCLLELSKQGVCEKYRDSIWKTCFIQREKPQTVQVKKHWWNFKKKLSQTFPFH